VNHRGLLIIFSGPSGSGKGTVLKRYFEKYQNAQLSISATTRDPRPGEKDGVSYYFVSQEKFQSMQENDELLESAKYCDHCYGTPKKPIENWLNEGKDVFLEIEVQGGAQIQKKVPQSVGIFNLPPSLKVLESRLRGRGTETEEVVEKRLTAAKQEISQAVHYDYLLINDDIERAVEELAQIINAEKMRSSRNQDLIERMLENHD
jgi:guanylate kinase